MAQRYVLWVRFNGTFFSGFAKAGRCGYGAISLLEEVLRSTLRSRGFNKIYASPGSRTDSGVHVLRGPVMIHTGVSKYLIDESAESKAEILNEANTILKNINHDPLELLDIHRVSPGFSLRKHVSYRRYVYRIRVAKSMEIYENCLNKPTISCFAERNNSWTLPPDFDYHRAVEVCSMFKGQHNLASFYKVPKKRQSLLLPSEHLTTRDLYLVRITAGKPISNMHDPLFRYYNFEVVAKSFLREQIRRMVKVLVAYSQRRMDTDKVRILFDYPDPNTFVNLYLVAAPAHGLYLVDCVYDPEEFMNPVPFVSHSWDLYGLEIDGKSQEEINKEIISC